MSRDYLAIPATSISVERLFSISHHLCTDVWNSLKAETITQSMCAKHWIRQGLLGKIWNSLFSHFFVTMYTWYIIWLELYNEMSSQPRFFYFQIEHIFPSQLLWLDQRKVEYITSHHASSRRVSSLMTTYTVLMPYFGLKSFSCVTCSRLEKKWSSHWNIYQTQ